MNRCGAPFLDNSLCLEVLIFVWEGVCKELHPLFASLKPLVDCGGVGVAQHEHGGLVVWMCAGKWCHKLAFLVNGATYCAQVREKSSCNGDGITSLRWQIVMHNTPNTRRPTRMRAIRQDMWHLCWKQHGSCMENAPKKCCYVSSMFVQEPKKEPKYFLSHILHIAVTFWKVQKHHRCHYGLFKPYFHTVAFLSLLKAKLSIWMHLSQPPFSINFQTKRKMGAASQDNSFNTKIMAGSVACLHLALKQTKWNYST